MTHYLIEFRLFGKAKQELKRLIWEVDRKFRLGHARRRRPVPHITLVGPFSTRNQRRLVRDFKELCSKQPIMEFKINGYKPFLKTRVVYVNIEPDSKLDEFRWELSKKLRSYCDLKSIDLERKFYFHATIAMKLPFFKFIYIMIWLLFMGPISKEKKHCLMRMTLIKNREILYEYDFFLRRLLNRREAKSRAILSKTYKKLKEYIEGKGKNRKEN